MFDDLIGKEVTITHISEGDFESSSDYQVDESHFYFSEEMLEPINDELEQLKIKLDNITRELISRTDKLAAAYKEIDRKEKLIKKQQKIIKELDKEAQRYFDDMLELSYKLESKEDLLKAIMKYVNNLGK